MVGTTPLQNQTRYATREQYLGQKNRFFFSFYFLLQKPALSLAAHAKEFRTNTAPTTVLLGAPHQSLFPNRPAEVVIIFFFCFFPRFAKDFWGAKRCNTRPKNGAFSLCFFGLHTSIFGIFL